MKERKPSRWKAATTELGLLLLGAVGVASAQAPVSDDVIQRQAQVMAQQIAMAQQTMTQQTMTEQQQTNPDAFVLGAGDQISLRVQDMDELSDKPMRIDPDGGIDLPLIGRVQAAGLTLVDFKKELSLKLSKYITNPEIAVTLVDNQSRPVSILGEVNAPGVHQLSGSRSLIEVISLAGGVKPTAGPKVIMTRQVQYGELPLQGAKSDASGRFTTATLNLDDLLAAKTPANNILIRPNDVISIPKGEIVYVVGDVRRAGGFPLTSHESITLLQALSLAEGLGPDAATQKAKILRPVPGGDGTPHEIPVDVKSIFAGKSPDVLLFAQDILFIPNSAAKTGLHRATEAVLQVATGVAIYAH